MAQRGGGWWGLDGGDVVFMEGIRTLSCAVSLTHRKGKKMVNYFEKVLATSCNMINITKYSKFHLILLIDTA
jgi:hypothetical protein